MREVGTFTVNAPAAEAFTLFTPLGERRWVEGWDPVFPASTHDDTAPGTVFTTVHDGHETIWVVTERDPGVSIAYARVTPHHRAGTVKVRCTSTGRRTTEVEVEYRLTSMTGAPEPPFPAGFFRAWEERIAEAVEEPAAQTLEVPASETVALPAAESVEEPAAQTLEEPAAEFC